MTRVLVTGASGFIGRPVVAQLHRRGLDVHATSRRRPTDLEEVVWHKADLLRPEAANNLMAAVRPTHLLHLAWIAEPGVYWTSDDNARWSDATVRLWQAFAHQGGLRAVGAGSCAEYDWGQGTCTEGRGEAPASPYGRHKLEAGRKVAALSSAAGLVTAWGRVFHLHGPREHPDRFVSALVRRLLAGQDAPMTHGRQVRDYLHVSDVAAALCHLLVDARLEGAVNIGSGRPVELREIASILHEAIGGPGRPLVGTLQAPPNEPLRIVPDVERLHSHAGWRPRLDLRAGLHDTVAWWRQQAVRGGP